MRLHAVLRQWGRKYVGKKLAALAMSTSTRVPALYRADDVNLSLGGGTASR